MSGRHCEHCGSPLESDHAFCGKCGKITKVGLKALTQREKTRRILLQLDLAFESGRLSKKAYEEKKARYVKRLAQIEIEESVAYANPPHLPWRGIVWYLILTFVLVFASVFLVWRAVGEGYETVWLDQWYLFFFSLTGPAVYLTWMYRHDKFEREPAYFLASILGWGAFAAFLSFLGNSLFDRIGLGMAWLSPPIVEESLKAIGVYFMAMNPEFNDSLDGMVYGFAAGVGFAWIENFFYIVYVYEGDIMAGLFRVFIFSFGHGVYTAFTGRALGVSKIKRGYVKPTDLIPGLILAMVAHGWYNSMLIPINNILSLVIWLLVTDGLFTLLLYTFVRKAWKQERLWLYDQGLAPKGQ